MHVLVNCYVCIKFMQYISIPLVNALEIKFVFYLVTGTLFTLHPLHDRITLAHSHANP